MYNTNKKSKQNTVLILRLDRKIASTTFIGTDSKKRKYRVEAEGSYKIGQTVRSIGGVAVAKVRKQKAPVHIIV